MDIRRNHRDMTPAQKSAFIEAILKLKNEVPSILRPGRQSRYDDFAQIHKNSMGLGDPIIPNPHRTPLFFPWHRILIRQFERELQAVARDPGITIPYWNWSMVGPDNPFTADFLGGNGDPFREQRVSTGRFALEEQRFQINVWDTHNGDPGLQRNFGNAPDEPLPSTQAIDTTMSRTPFWSHPLGWANHAEMELHNPVHSWVGGNMARASSPNDPVFFLHHCYLDLLWERWKRQHPTEPPFSSAPDFEHAHMNSTLIFQAENLTAPWPQTWTVMQTLDTEELNYRYELRDLE